MSLIASPLRRFSRRLAVAALSSVLLSALLGCGSFRHPANNSSGEWDPNACAGCGDADCNDGFCLCTRRYVRCFDEKQVIHDAIARANFAMRTDYSSRPSTDVRAGYRDAFIDIALGASGEVPPVPPERYWTVCYRTADGHARANDWFAGYRTGAGRALTSCRQRYNSVPASGQTAFAAGLEPVSTTNSPYFNSPADNAGW